jgi:hypothetical protein
MERRGHPVLDELGIFWWRQGRYMYLSLPHQLAADLDPHELGAVLRRRRVLGMRHPTLHAPGEANALFVCHTQGFSLARVRSTRRARVKRGLARAQMRRVEPDELLAQGMALNLETMRRQRRFAPEFGEPEQWRRFVEAVRACPEVSVYGAFLGERLSSYHVLCRDGAWQHSLVKMSRTQDLALHTSSALDVWVLQEAAKDPALEAVASGEVNHVKHLVEYKVSIGFELLPIRTAWQLHPALEGMLANRWTQRATGALSSALPGVRRLRVLARASEAARATAAFFPTPSAARTAHHGP